MGQSPFKTEKFKKLSKKWASKLKKSGFEDIESGDKLVRQDGSWFTNHIDSLKFESTRDFYLQCEKFLNEHKFQSLKHEQIWMCFSKGLTLQEIERQITLKKSQIANIINKYVQIMKEENGNSR